MNQRRQQLTPFPFGWYSLGLPGYRDGGTYTLYASDELPPLPKEQLTGTLQWLVPLDQEIDTIMQPYRFSAQLRAEWHPGWMKGLQALVASVRQKGLYLPAAFLSLMASPEFQDRIPSCTDCYFGCSELAPCPGSNEGSIIRFLNDKQGCFRWYLYLSPTGEECVLVSDLWLDEVQIISQEGELDFDHTYVCAPSFEAFLYRFWIENILYLNLSRQKPLTEEQEQYLAYYTQ